MSSSSSAYKTAIKQLMVRIQANANDINSIVRPRASFLRSALPLASLSRFRRLDSIERHHRAVPAELPSQRSLRRMSTISRSSRPATSRSLSEHQRFSTVDGSMVEIQARRGEEESRIFRSETAAAIVSRRSSAAIGTSE